MSLKFKNVMGSAMSNIIQQLQTLLRHSKSLEKLTSPTSKVQYSLI